MIAKGFRSCKCVISSFRTISITAANNEEPLLYRKHGGVVLIGLNRPHKRNALNVDLIGRLEDAINKYEIDDEARTAVIFGEGGNFCAGYDLEELNTNDDVPNHFIHNKLTEKFVTKPIIAAVSGYAVGAGFDLALWCDLRVLENSAVIGCLSRRYGMTMPESGIGRLQAIVGLSVAMDILLSGRSIKSDEAQKFGIANVVTDPGLGLGRALQLAQDISKYPQAGVLADRAALYKHIFAKISLKSSGLDDSVRNSQVIVDAKRGAKLFASGHGKHGVNFSCNVWKDL